MQNGNHESQQEEKAPKPYREFGQNRRRLGTEKIISQTAAKSRAKTFALGSLHDDGQDHQQADNHQEGYEDRHEEPHSP